MVHDNQDLLLKDSLKHLDYYEAYSPTIHLTSLKLIVYVLFLLITNDIFMSNI